MSWSRDVSRSKIKTTNEIVKLLKISFNNGEKIVYKRNDFVQTDDFLISNGSRAAECWSSLSEITSHVFSPAKLRYLWGELIYIISTFYSNSVRSLINRCNFWLAQTAVVMSGRYPFITRIPAMMHYFSVMFVWFNFFSFMSSSPCSVRATASKYFLILPTLKTVYWA